MGPRNSATRPGAGAFGEGGRTVSSGKFNLPDEPALLP